MRSLLLSIIIILLTLSLLNTVSAQVEITSIFADENSMDITLHSSDPITDGSVEFILTHQGEIVEIQTMDLDLEPDSDTTKVIMWQNEPRLESYVATAKVYVNDELVAESPYPFTYGFVVLPRFQVVDLSASSSGVSLLVKPRTTINPAVADFTFQLIHDNDIIYSKTRDNIPITQPTQLSINWPILLDDHTDYMVRVKAYSHTPDIVSSYVTRFSARQDVEIDVTDVDVDDFGVSVTLFGRSQVPFDGTVEVQLKRDDVLYRTFSEKPDILTLDRDDTVGIIWDDLEAGEYHVFILVKSGDGELLDRYETILVIPERINPIGTSVPPQSPGFSVLVSVFCILFIVMFLKHKW